MKMNTCATKASTPVKNSKQTISISNLSFSNKRRKSMTIYSALKKQNNMLSQFQTPTNKIHSIKPHLQLKQDKKQVNIQQESQTKSKVEENRGIMIKMNLCGPKLCDINVQNSYKLCDEDKIIDQSLQKDNRVIYMSRKAQKLGRNWKYNESNIDKKNNFQISELNTNYYNNSLETQIKMSHTTKKPSSAIHFHKEYQWSEKHNNKLTQQPYKQSLVQYRNFDQPFLGQISNISIKNELKAPQRQQNTKNNSFSIRNFSTSDSPFQTSFENMQQTNKIYQSAQNYDKLKQIYQNTFRSSNSNQDIHLTRFYQEIFQQDNSQKQLNPTNDLTINIQTIKDKNLNNSINQSQSYLNNSYLRPLDSNRTIIQMLNDGDCKSELPQSIRYDDQNTLKLQQKFNNMSIFR